MLLKPILNPRVILGNVVVEVDCDDYHGGVEDLKFSTISRSTLQRSDPIPMMMEVRRKLSNLWQIKDIMVIPLGNGVYHILLHNLEDHCKALAVGTMFLKLGVMRLNMWLPRFNTVNQIQITTQVRI